MMQTSSYVKLISEELTVEIRTIGAELQSIKGKNGTEFLWYGDEKVWSGRAPILFPICGGLKEDKFFYNGKYYFLPKHGFGQSFKYEIEYNSSHKAVFLLKSNDETKKLYPFDFEFRVVYELKGKQLKVCYATANITNSKMYFSVGAHEGYNCPEGIEEYDVIFEKEETLVSYLLNGNILSNDTICVLEKGNVFPLKCEYFEVDALVFRDIKSDSVVLKHRNSGKSVQIDFPEHDYLLLWTKPTGEYICIEPWCGIQDVEGSDYNITNKEGVICLEKGEKHSVTHTITFNEADNENI